MIKKPAILTIKRSIERPDNDLIESLRGVPTAFVVDAMSGRGALMGGIGPLVEDMAVNGVFVGTALTCHCGPADNLALCAALASVQPGDVLVAATDRFEATCVTGDLVLGMAQNQGAVGFVTDGLVRDVDAILAVGLPVFCRGVIPNSPVGNGPGTVGFDVVLGGVTVSSGDVVVGDRDGVVIIPKADLAEVIERVNEIKTLEAESDRAVKAGRKMPDAVKALLDSDRVEYVD